MRRQICCGDADWYCHMNIMYFATHQFWPINGGARVRDFQLARRLAARCSVTFVEMSHVGEERCRPPDDCGVSSIVTLDRGRGYTLSKVIRGMTGPIPLTVLNCWSPQSFSA